MSSSEHVGAAVDMELGDAASGLSLKRKRGEEAEVGRIRACGLSACLRCVLFYALEQVTVSSEIVPTHHTAVSEEPAEAEPDVEAAATSDKVECWATELIRIECQLSHMMLTYNELKAFPSLARAQHRQLVRARGVSELGDAVPVSDRPELIPCLVGPQVVADVDGEVSIRGAGRPRGSRWRRSGSALDHQGWLTLTVTGAAC